MNIFTQKKLAKEGAAQFRSLTGAQAQKLFREDRAEYDRLRTLAQEHGVLGKPAYAVQSDLPAAKTELTFSPDQLQARARWSKQDCEKFYKNNKDSADINTVAKLQKDSPEDARLLRIAAISHHVIADSPAPAAPVSKLLQQPAASDEVRIPIGKVLADKLNLPETYRASGPLEFAEIVNLAKAKDADIAAAAKTEGQK